VEKEKGVSADTRPVVGQTYYYEIRCFADGVDVWEVLPWKGTVCAVASLVYLEPTQLYPGEFREDESLAMKILIQNVNRPHFAGTVADKLKRMIEGRFEKVLVRKYEFTTE
jgi:hypothetical protein